MVFLWPRNKTPTKDWNVTSAMNYGYIWTYSIVLKFHMWHRFNVHTRATTGNIWKENPPNLFWKQQLRAPFAAREWENVSCISDRVEGNAREEVERKCISSICQLSSDGSASGVSYRVLGCCPLSQQGSKINEGSFRQLNKAAVKPNNKWAL